MLKSSLPLERSEGMDGLLYCYASWKDVEEIVAFL